MSETYHYEWAFSPPDYFETAADFVSSYGLIKVTSGKVSLEISPEKYPSDHSLRNQIHRDLDARFLGAQAISHKPYVLNNPNVFKLYADGRRDTWAFAECGTVTTSGSEADFITKDAAGNVIRNTRQERIDKRKAFAQLASKYIGNATANAILRSYSAAVNDPNNELVHLYEIRDALSRHFKGEKAARKATSISKSQWSTLGRLSNDEPLSQGRHRGKSIGVLRDATKEELGEARSIARAMLDGFLNHLESRARRP